MSLISTFTIGTPQHDGRCYVTEIHRTTEGTIHQYLYLCEKSRLKNVETVMATRKISLSADLLIAPFDQLKLAIEVADEAAKLVVELQAKIDVKTEVKDG